MKKQLTLFVVLMQIALQVVSQSTPQDLVIKIKTQSNLDQSITLNWQAPSQVSSFVVLRKNRSSATFTIVANNLPAQTTSYTDNTIADGQAYEYSVQDANNPNITGYVYAGEKLAVNHVAGRVLLVIDNTYQTTAAVEINDYKLDLIKEGWKVNLQYVSRTQSANSVKALINNIYNTYATDLKGVILLGHVPVPYSGKIAPDAHVDHLGAWPADMYYGNVQYLVETTNWNDAVLNINTSTDPRNYNLIGDGKFDVSTKSTVAANKLFVSRVDVFNMPTINSNDLVLFKQYLAKNHSYRAGIKKFNQQSVIDDNFGFQNGEAFSQNGWRNFSALVGPEKVASGDYLTSLKTSSYIWSYGCGGGWNTGSAGIGNTNDFKTNQAEGVFTMLFGSYFGDWDTRDNFLRAPIASPSSTLVSCWGGRPNWFFHTMALGEPIGYSYLNSVNNVNTYFPKGFYADQIHQALQGDATLKMYVFEAPKNLVVTPSLTENHVKLTWAASQDAEVIGYYVYRANSIDDEFQLMNTSMEASNEFIDTTPEALDQNNQFAYMVRAVKLQQSTTGSFYNLSPGEVGYRLSMATPLPLDLISFTGTKLGSSNKLSWKVANEKNLLGYEVERSVDQNNFERIGFVSFTSTPDSKMENQYEFMDEMPLETNFYRLKMIDIDGKATYSSIVALQENPEAAIVKSYPNPFINQLTIELTTEVAKTLNVQLMDMMGRIVSRNVFITEVGFNSIQLNQLNSLSSGMYHLNILDEEGQVMFKEAVLK